MRILRRRLGIPLEAAEKLLGLNSSIGKLMEGGLGVRKDEGYVEIMVEGPAVRFTQTSLIPIHPNVYSIGDGGNYFSDVVSANLTISSLAGWKRGVRPADPTLWDIPLPQPKAYTRVWRLGGRIMEREEIGLVAEELPPHLRTAGGYSLNILTTILVGKIGRLEEEVGKLAERLAILEKKLGGGLMP